KLQELQVAFCLLSKQIQGLDGEGNHVLTCPNPPVPAAQRTDPLESPALITPPTEATGSKPQRFLDSRLTVSSAVVPGEEAGTSRARVRERVEAARDSVRKSKPISHVEGRNAVEPIVPERGQQDLRLLRRELEAEKRSRIAAESALQQLQRRAAESALERERLERVVNSFGGRSLEELSTRLQATERRMREAEAALAPSQHLAAEKAAESLEALEQAASLAESLETERTARIAAENEKRTVTQELRCCLRGRAKAEQEAKAARGATKKSEAQRDSLTQRLEILRTANRRLEKRAAAVALPASFAAGTGIDIVGSGNGGCDGDSAGNTAARLLTARARLKVLSASGRSSVMGSNAGVWGHPREHDGEIEACKEKAAIERAMSNAVGEKRWRDKLRRAEMQGEAFQSAAIAAETGLKIAVRQSAELEEVTRILAKKLAHDKYDTKRGSIVQIGTTSNAAGGKRPVSLLAAGDDDVENTTDTPEGGGAERARTCSTPGIPAPVAEREGQPSVPEQCCRTASFPPPPILLPDTEQVTDATGKAIASGGKPACSTGEVCGPALPEKETDRDALTGNDPATQTSQHLERGCALGEVERRRQMPPTPHGSGCQASVSSTTIESVSECKSGTRTTPPSPVEKSCLGHQSRSRSASVGEVPTLSTRRCGIMAPQAQLQHHEQEQYQRHTHRHHRQQHPQQKSPRQQLHEEASRRMREEVLFTERNCAYGSNLQASSGEDDFGSGGGCGREGWRKLRQENAQHQSTVASVPIEVLLRLCDRSVRGTRCEKEAAYSVCSGDRTGCSDPGKDPTANQSADEVGGKEDTKSRDYGVEQPAKQVAFPATDNAARPAVPLPPGITPTLAEQVQGAVSRGDERGFLEIIERCGSTEKGGIARLLSIGAPE
ncbi:unnamed protein product, partial [Scytosiphon promiscuus]